MIFLISDFFFFFGCRRFFEVFTVRAGAIKPLGGLTKFLKHVFSKKSP